MGYFCYQFFLFQVIIVGTVTGKWVVLNAATREVFSVNQESGGGEPVYSCKFSPDGKLLALGSRDNAIYIYQVRFEFCYYFSFYEVIKFGEDI